MMLEGHVSTIADDVDKARPRERAQYERRDQVSLRPLPARQRGVGLELAQHRPSVIYGVVEPGDIRSGKVRVRTRRQVTTRQHSYRLAKVAVFNIPRRSTRR